MLENSQQAYTPEMAEILGVVELSAIEREMLRMLEADSTKDCGTGTCS